MQNLDQKHPVLAQFLRQNGERQDKEYFYFILIMACEKDIRRSSFSCGLIGCNGHLGPWPYHTIVHIPNQVMQRRESQPERWFGTRSRLLRWETAKLCFPNRVLKMGLTIVSFGRKNFIAAKRGRGDRRLHKSLKKKNLLLRSSSLLPSPPTLFCGSDHSEVCVYVIHIHPLSFPPSNKKPLT